jgi:hypothetical protein
LHPLKLGTQYPVLFMHHVADVINTLEQRRFFEHFLTAWEVLADDLEGYEEDLEDELEELQGMDLATTWTTRWTI